LRELEKERGEKEQMREEAERVRAGNGELKERLDDSGLENEKLTLKIRAAE
jgi:hypothetical protein